MREERRWRLRWWLTVICQDRGHALTLYINNTDISLNIFPLNSTCAIVVHEYYYVLIHFLCSLHMFSFTDNE